MTGHCIAGMSVLRYVEIMHFLFQYRQLHRAEHLLPESEAVSFCGAPCIESQKNISARNICAQENRTMVQPTVPETCEFPKQKGEET
jgi:hypothetical protein